MKEKWRTTRTEAGQEQRDMQEGKCWDTTELHPRAWGKTVNWSHVLIWFCVLPGVKPSHPQPELLKDTKPILMESSQPLGSSCTPDLPHFDLNRGRVRTSSDGFATRFRDHSIIEAVQVPRKGYEQNIITWLLLRHETDINPNHEWTKCFRMGEGRWLVAEFAQALSSVPSDAVDSSCRFMGLSRLFLLIYKTRITKPAFSKDLHLQRS